MVIDMENICDRNGVLLKKVELNVKECNKIAHEAIAAREREFIADIILNAAHKGCFSAILPTISQDTRDWLYSLGFSTFTNSCGLNICWDDKVIEDD